MTVASEGCERSSKPSGQQWRWRRALLLLRADARAKEEAQRGNESVGVNGRVRGAFVPIVARSAGPSALYNRHAASMS